MNFPTDPDRRKLIEVDIETLATRYFDERYIEDIIAFFETPAGQAWMNAEVPFLNDLERVITAHISFLRADFLLKDIGVRQDTEETEDEPTHLN